MRVRKPGALAAGVALALGVGSLALVGGALALRGPADPGATGAAADAAAFGQAYRFDAGGSLPLLDRAELPVAPDSVIARWHTFRGWAVVVFEGLDLGRSGPLCLGTSVLDAATHQLEHLSNSPTAADACDSGGAGQVVLAPADRGVRVCGGVIAVITGIPAETSGVLYASVTSFPGDGTGVGIASRLETATGPIDELDPATLACGPLPIARAVRTPAPVAIPTPAPASTGSIAAASRAAAPNPTRPSRCPALTSGGLQDVTNSAVGPYLVNRPRVAASSTPTVVFLGGGSGGRASAQRVWEIVFAGRPEASEIQVVLPYSIDVNFIDEAPRTLAVVNEVLSCYGGDPGAVHVAGMSNGGLAAFALMAAHPDYFATLLGAPGAFPVRDPATLDPAGLAQTLAGRAVFNGVGARDDAWKSEVVATHNALASAGIESVFLELPGQAHVLNETLDPSAFYDFWASH